MCGHADQSQLSLSAVYIVQSSIYVCVGMLTSHNFLSLLSTLFSHQSAVCVGMLTSHNFLSLLSTLFSHQSTCVWACWPVTTFSLCCLRCSLINLLVCGHSYQSKLSQSPLLMHIHCPNLAHFHAYWTDLWLCAYMYHQHTDWTDLWLCAYMYHQHTEQICGCVLTCTINILTGQICDCVLTCTINILDRSVVVCLHVPSTYWTDL